MSSHLRACTAGLLLLCALLSPELLGAPAMASRSGPRFPDGPTARVRKQLQKAAARAAGVLGIQVDLNELVQASGQNISTVLIPVPNLSAVTRTQTDGEFVIGMLYISTRKGPIPAGWYALRFFGDPNKIRLISTAGKVVEELDVEFSAPDPNETLVHTSVEIQAWDAEYEFQNAQFAVEFHIRTPLLAGGAGPG